MQNEAVTVGAIIHIETPDADAYIGTVTEVHGNVVTLADYSAWYEGANTPYSSPYPGDEVRVAITAKTFVGLA